MRGTWAVERRADGPTARAAGYNDWKPVNPPPALLFQAEESAQLRNNFPHHLSA
jgi:hypothetical protein